jgi:hypothetical protein
MEDENEDDDDEESEQELYTESMVSGIIESPSPPVVKMKPQPND